MNLKEAFRFQNRIQSFMTEVQSILCYEHNITKVQNTHLRKKVMADAEDETIVEISETEYSEQITELAEFLMFLLSERERLSAAIQRTKENLSMEIDIDSEVSLNGKRQEVERLFRRMVGIRNSERLITNGGTGYCFNNEGNQVSYCCDLKRVTAINFDRNKIRKFAMILGRKSDEISCAIDECMINSKVDYSVPFDVNDSFAEVFEEFCSTAA